MKKEKNKDKNKSDIKKELNEEIKKQKEDKQKLKQEEKKVYQIKISDAVFENILIAVAIMIYFILINFAYYRIEEETLLLGLKILSMLVLGLSIIVIEIAYKKDNGKIAINGIELLVLAGYTLSIAHVVEAQKLEFANYILISSYIFSIYYLLKAIIIFTKERRDYLKSFSDIREIVENKPIKKEAKKKNQNHTEK